MSIIIRKIWHRDAFRIGIYFDYNSDIISKLKSIKAAFSSTNKCWYLDYSAASYALLKNNFDAIEIDTAAQLSNKTQLVTGNSRDLSPIATSKSQLGLSQKGNPEHKTGVNPFAQKMRLQLLDSIGKYWVFKMHYHESISKQLLSVKGVYWNSGYKAYMVLRNPKVKENVEQILMTSPFFGNDYLSKDINYRGQVIRILPHPEDIAWIEVYVPKIIAVHEKLKRFSMARYSKTKDCYLMPAAPIVLESIQLQMEAFEILVSNELPKLYLQKNIYPIEKTRFN